MILFDFQETIKRRKLSFEAKSHEIEAALLLAEEKERRWLDEEIEKEPKGNVEARVPNNSERDIGEIQQEKMLMNHGKSLLLKLFYCNDTIFFLNECLQFHLILIFYIQLIIVTVFFIILFRDYKFSFSAKTH